MNKIPLLIARLLLKVEKKEEMETFSKWEKTSEKNSQFADVLKKYWNQAAEEIPSGRLDLAHNRLLARINSGEEIALGRTLTSYFVRIAAVLVFAFTISALSIYIASKNDVFNQNNWVEVSTEAGQQSKVSLPDGSLVWLNAETIVKYRQGKDKREVNLEGEAYFEVAHSEQQPFIVETENVKVKVLGTKFNVSHYNNSKETEASLLSGKITMLVDGSNNEIELAPGEKVIYNEGQGVVFKRNIKVQNEISWRQGILVFDNEPFSEFVRKLERYYAVKFIYEKSAFENIHYTGSIDKLNIDNVLEFINMTIPINYEIDNKTIKLDIIK